MWEQGINRLSGFQAQCGNDSLPTLYKKFCKDNNLSPEFINSNSGVNGFWVGNKNAKHIVIYYHGGGFVLDGSLEHLKFWYDVQNDVVASGVDVAFLYVLYTLVPHATYPTQIREGVEALRFVLEELGRSPDEIILAGDSAGGNMCLATLSHLSHPHPDIKRLDINQSLNSIIMMAPWISFRECPSFQRNAYKDFLSPAVNYKWSSDYMAGATPSPYSEALLADLNWWKDAKVKKMLVVAENDEILIDSITEWVAKYKEANNDIEYVRGNNGVHVAPMIWYGEQETDSEVAIKAWMKARL